MGQQKFLRTVVVIIIAGVATVAAIHIFRTVTGQANKDAVKQDLLAAAYQAQAVWARPVLMDGAGKDFTSFESDAELLRLLKIPSDEGYTPGKDTELSNENGTYTITGREAETLTLTGTPAGGSDVITLVLTRNTDTGNWNMTINGEEVEPEKS